MAEKEERIRVLIAKNPCKECSVEKCTRKCTFGLLFEKAPGITRQEAVERMAKEMARLYCPEKPTKKEFESIWEYELLLSTQKHFKELAEAALNALLEGK